MKNNLKQAEGSKKKVTAVIVDSGVKYDSELFSDDFVEGFTYCDGEIQKDFIDEYGHGTATYNILHKIEDIRIINIKLKNIERNVNEDAMIQVLEYIEKNITCNLINLSFGVSISREYQRLKEICERLEEKGVIIVASFDNVGSMSYPAALESVIGVAEGSYCAKITDFEYYDDPIVNIGAKSSVQRVAWSEPKYLFIGGNSFACVHVTAYIAQLMKQGIFEKSDILQKIREVSIKARNKTEVKENSKDELFEIKKAAIFPFNKEMHSIVRFSDLLSFEITNVYDVRYSGTVGSTTTHILKDENVLERKIENIDKIDWDAFDTLIIGHIEHLKQHINHTSLMKELLEAAAVHKKQVYCFDDVSSYITKENEDMFQYPVITKDNLPWNHLGKLYRHAKPVLGIFGTSSKQGKVTLQLTLRKYFQEAGYNLGEIGTEPHALLFGMDYVFPMGYNSSVYLSDFEVVLYLNHIVNELCKQDKDIIMVGSQSGSVTYDEGNLVQYAIPQYHFLLGTQPEVIILCVNVYDSVEYINRTIRFLEASIETKVISLVLFPKDVKKTWDGMYGSKEMMTEERQEQVKQKMMEVLKKPVFRLNSEKDTRQLFDYIINYFSC